MLTPNSTTGCPNLEKVLLKVLDRVKDPVRNQTLLSLWRETNKKIGGLGAGSDYVAFQDMAGTSSLDLGFDGPAYPYHSCHDNFEWMTKFGDPGFQYHTALAEVWALLILEMADSPILPLDIETYAHHIHDYVGNLDKYVKTKGHKEHTLDLKSLHAATDFLSEAASEFHGWDEAWREIVYAQNGFESNVMAIKRVSHNTRLANFDTDLLDIDGGVSVSTLP